MLQELEKEIDAARDQVKAAETDLQYNIAKNVLESLEKKRASGIL